MKNENDNSSKLNIIIVFQILKKKDFHFLLKILIDALLIITAIISIFNKKVILGLIFLLMIPLVALCDYIYLKKIKKNR